MCVQCPLALRVPGSRCRSLLEGAGPVSCTGTTRLRAGGGPAVAQGAGPVSCTGMARRHARGGPGVVYGAGPASRRGSPSWGRLARLQQRVRLLHSRQEHGNVLHPPRAPWADVPRPPPWIELTSSLWGAGSVSTRKLLASTCGTAARGSEHPHLVQRQPPTSRPSAAS